MPPGLCPCQKVIADKIIINKKSIENLNKVLNSLPINIRKNNTVEVKNIPKPNEKNILNIFLIINSTSILTGNVVTKLLKVLKVNIFFYYNNYKY